MTAAMSRAEVLALPPVIDLRTLGRALGLSEPTVRAANRSGELAAMGVKVNKLGSQFKVVSASLWSALGIAPDSETDGGGNEKTPCIRPRQGRATATLMRTGGISAEDGSDPQPTGRRRGGPTAAFPSARPSQRAPAQWWRARQDA